MRFFDQMKKMLMDEADRPSQAQVANEFEMTENAVKQKPFTDLVTGTKHYYEKRSLTQLPCPAMSKMNWAI